MNAVDNEQHSALHWAIVCGELEALDLLHKVVVVVVVVVVVC